MSVHAVIGARGAIGQATVAALSARNIESLSLGRAQVDARDRRQLARSLEGVECAYLCVGLPYEAKIWEDDFPRIATATAEACGDVGARLVYLDNAYLYGPPPLTVPFGENAPRHPSARKGVARLRAVEGAMAVHEQGRAEVVVGRCADFYGPAAIHSAFYVAFLENMLAGKPPITTMPEGPVHGFAYSPDIGRALVQLGLEPSCSGHEFHLPVGEPIPVSEMARMLNQELGTAYPVRYLPPIAADFLALFSRPLREAREMRYLHRTDFVMCDAKFRSTFPGFTTTPYEEGVRAMVQSFR